jgi:two-component system sensor histidine kinase FlrB
MLRAVVLNLLLNACQATGGTHEIEVATSLAGGKCQIRILDRGPGIPSDLHERVFDPFFTTKSGGTGLGLPIVKRLMEAQGGSIRLSTRDGGGTSAELVLPLEPA